MSRIDLLKELTRALVIFLQYHTFNEKCRITYAHVSPLIPRGF